LPKNRGYQFKSKKKPFYFEKRKINFCWRKIFRNQEAIGNKKVKHIIKINAEFLEQNEIDLADKILRKRVLVRFFLL